MTSEFSGADLIADALASWKWSMFLPLSAFTTCRFLMPLIVLAKPK